MEQSYSARCGQRLREIRESKGKSAADVARYLTHHGCKTSYGAIFRWEGEATPPLNAFRLLATYYGVKPRHLLAKE